MSAQVVARDKPALWWILSVMFIGVSLALLYLGVQEWSTLPLWQGSLVVLLGVGGTGAGLWIAGYAPLSTISIDQATSTLTIARSGIRGRQVHAVPIATIRRLTVERRDDDEGYPMSRPALLLADGETIALSMLWRHGELDTLEIARQVLAAVPGLTIESTPRGKTKV